MRNDQKTYTPTEFETLMVSAILHEVSIDENTLEIDLLRPKQP